MRKTALVIPPLFFPLILVSLSLYLYPCIFHYKGAFTDIATSLHWTLAVETVYTTETVHSSFHLVHRSKALPVYHRQRPGSEDHHSVIRTLRVQHFDTSVSGAVYWAVGRWPQIKNEHY